MATALDRQLDAATELYYFDREVRVACKQLLTGSALTTNQDRHILRGNQTDRLVLKDSRGNPADTVEYFENGSWPSQADGGGSSLELRDPDSDNSSSLAWAASIEGDDSPWTDYNYQGVAGRSSIGPDAQWNELVLGLLDAGEVLLDLANHDDHAQCIVVDASGRLVVAGRTDDDIHRQLTAHFSRILKDPVVIVEHRRQKLQRPNALLIQEVPPHM